MKLFDLRRGAGRVMFVFAGGNAIASIIGMASGLLTARLVEPADLGLFNGFKLILAYLPFVQMGIINGLSRELPYHAARNELVAAQGLAATAMTWMLWAASVSGIVVLILGGRAGVLGNWKHALGWLTMVECVFFLFMSRYLEATFQATSNFERLAKVRVTMAFSHFLLLILVWKYHFWGLCLRVVLVEQIAFWMLWNLRPFKVRLQFDRKNLGLLMRTGFPIFLCGQTYGWWEALNKTLILKDLGKEQFGFYAVSLLVLQFGSILPVALAQITYPKMCEMYAAVPRIGVLIRYTLGPSFLLFLAMLCGWLVVRYLHVIPKFLSLVLPKYINGTEAAEWTLLFVALRSFGAVMMIFNAIKKQWYRLGAILIGVATYITFYLFFLGRSAPLAGYVKGMVLGQCAFVSSGFLFLLILYLRERKFLVVAP